MNTRMLGLLAETSIHPGTGRSMGVVDLPVAREAATDYPVLVGSSLKGALRDRAGGDTKEAQELFGKSDQAGNLLISDGRLLLLPVRCLTGAFRWVTCPHLIERYLRDRSRAGLEVGFSVPTFSIPQDTTRPALGVGEEKIFLEEREFALSGPPEHGLVDAIAELLVHNDAKSRLRDRLVVLHDDDFAWFARYGLPIQARNVLDHDTKQSKNLWYEETLPAETVLYALVAGRTSNALTQLTDSFASVPYLQAGGNETVGQGWFAITVLTPEEGGKP